jgi:hypothetical protein
MNGAELVSDANVAAFSASVPGTFPHMSRADSRVWRAFMSVSPVPLDDVVYDLGAGGKAANRIPDTDELKVMWKTLTRKRIDAVIIRPDYVLACEVKPLANMSALGQALTYAYLLNHSTSFTVTAWPCVVAGRVDDDVEEVFLNYGVLVFLVSGSKPGESPRLEKVLGPLPR